MVSICKRLSSPYCTRKKKRRKVMDCNPFDAKNITIYSCNNVEFCRNLTVINESQISISITVIAYDNYSDVFNSTVHHFNNNHYSILSLNSSASNANNTVNNLANNSHFAISNNISTVIYRNFQSALNFFPKLNEIIIFIFAQFLLTNSLNLLFVQSVAVLNLFIFVLRQFKAVLCIFNYYFQYLLKLLCEIDSAFSILPSSYYILVFFSRRLKKLPKSNKNNNNSFVHLPPKRISYSYSILTLLIAILTLIRINFAGAISLPYSYPKSTKINRINASISRNLGSLDEIPQTSAIMLDASPNYPMDSVTNRVSKWKRPIRSLAPLADIFPLRGAVFLPHATNVLKTQNMVHSDEDDEQHERHLATIESVMPIIDIAIADAERRYLKRWVDAASSVEFDEASRGTCGRHWLCIYEAPIAQCDAQKRAAWATLEALQWTNGSGLDVSFGPACDYVLATITRILSFHHVTMFTNAGFSEFFQVKTDMPLTRVGPLQEHVTKMLEEMFLRFEWKKSQLLYEKTFWESELREAGFCKLLMNGLYFRSVERKWPLQMDARILPHAADGSASMAARRAKFKAHLIDSVGINYGGGA